MKSILPFHLTGAQKRVLREIADDMRSPHPMNRLVQGDVGSGKTMVALLVDRDRRRERLPVGLHGADRDPRGAALPDLPPAAREGAVSRRAADRRRARARSARAAYARLASGETTIAVGTHALIQEGVAFQRLGLAVIDEQHRFGVLQREDLRRKGLDVDVLVMTATPIPRTLALTAYGDLDVSVVDERPPGRTPIRTLQQAGDAAPRGARAACAASSAAGRQAYVVYPLVEESEKLEDVKAATQMAARVGARPARRRASACCTAG